MDIDEARIKGKKYEELFRRSCKKISKYLCFDYDENGDVEKTYFSADTPQEIADWYGGLLSPGNYAGNLLIIS